MLFSMSSCSGRSSSIYGGNNLPEKQFLLNTLEQQFGIEPSDHDEFVEIFTKNCRFLGIGAQFTIGGRVEVRTGGGVAGIHGEGDEGTITVATPDENAGDSPVLFVIMPFSERQEEHETGFFKEVLARVVHTGRDGGRVHSEDR